MGSNDGKSEFHSGRINCDRCAGHGCAQIDWVAYAEAEAQVERLREEFGPEKVEEWRAQWRQAQAEVRHQSVDGVHPRDAKEKTQVVREPTFFAKYIGELNSDAE